MQNWLSTKRDEIIKRRKHTQLDSFHNPTNRAIARYSYMRRTLHKKKTPPPPTLQKQSIEISRIILLHEKINYFQKIVCQIPNRKLVDHLMEKIRTNTAPPEPSHPLYDELWYNRLCTEDFSFESQSTFCRRFTQPRRNWASPKFQATFDIPHRNCLENNNLNKQTPKFRS